MKNQFAQGEPDNAAFYNLLQRMRPLLREKYFLNLSDDELDAGACMMEYRVQRDFYELVKETVPNMTWKEFVLLLRSSSELREMAMAAISRKLEREFFPFDFSGKETGFFRKADESDGGSYAKLFSKEEGICVMSLVLYFAEQAHFNRLRDTVRVPPEYKWETYCHDLEHGKSLWNEVLTVFQNTVKQMDFKPEFLEMEKEHG